MNNYDISSNNLNLSDNELQNPTFINSIMNLRNIIKYTIKDIYHYTEYHNDYSQSDFMKDNCDEVFAGLWQLIQNIPIQ